VRGLLQRDGHVRAMVAPNRKTPHVRKHVLDNVELGSSLYTDEADVYKHLNGEFVHALVDHISKVRRSTRPRERDGEFLVASEENAWRDLCIG